MAKDPKESSGAKVEAPRGTTATKERLDFARSFLGFASDLTEFERRSHRGEGQPVQGPQVAPIGCLGVAQAAKASSGFRWRDEPAPTAVIKKLVRPTDRGEGGSNPPEE